MRRLSYPALITLFLLSAAWATETENFGIRILPAPGPVQADGSVADWDLTGGIFACQDVEKQRDHYGVWFHAMYDAEHLYLLARFIDETPLNNPGDSKLEFAWQGDSIQVRTVIGDGTPEAQKSVLNCWKGRDGRDVVDLDSPPRTKNSPKGDDAKPQGIQQAFQVQEGHGYTQEIIVPWKLLTTPDRVPKAGDTIVMTIEPNYSLGATGRLSIKDLFRPGVPIDRVFTFNAQRCWGEAKLVAQGRVEPQPLRLSDGRLLPVRMEKGLPVVDWSSLVEIAERPGFEPIRFTLPGDGYVSIVIKNRQGEIVRQLLTGERRPRGENTVQWDGLTTYRWRTPGEPVEPGDYTWSGIYHPGIGLKWRGFAANAGTVPWDNGMGTNWGGDMAPPDSVATEGDYVLLGWHASEAGKAAVLCDLEGRPLWSHKRGGFGGAPFVGLDQGVAFIVDHAVVYKLKVADATLVPWTGGGAGEMSFRELVGGDTTIPATPQGMAVRGSKLYLSSSNYGFGRDDVSDWRAFLTQLSATENNPAAGAIWSKLPAEVQNRVRDWLKGTGTNPEDLRAIGNAPDVRDVIVPLLNKALQEPGLSGQTNATGAALAAANRRWLESQYPALAKRTSGFVAIVDAVSGKFERKVALDGAGEMAADDKGAYVIVDGKSLVFIDRNSGAAKTVLENLPAASAAGLDAEGNFYIGSATRQQVIVYAPDGKSLRTIGREGGRAATGPWQGDAMRGISAVAVDRENKVWVGEFITTPRRFSTWDAQSGRLIGEYFGPTHYGASGGAILPSDPNVMVGEACEWQLDPATGRAVCTGVFDDQFHAFARFARGSNGRQYLAAVGPSYIGHGFGVNNIKIFERSGPGKYHLRSSVKSYRPEDGGPRTEFWADRNGDEKAQPDEIQTLPIAVQLGGYYLWSMFMNADLTLYVGGAHGSADQHVLQIKTSGFTPVGAPLYDVTGARPLDVANVPGGLSSLDNRYLLVSDNVEQGRESYRLYDLSQNRKLWGYNNDWSGVHGSHKAPPPEPGLFRGAFGIVGSAHLPEPVGDVWAISTNLGEWHLLTRDGFYLSRLFQTDAIQYEFPPEATPGLQVDNIPPGLGMEDFGGSLQQAPDGKVYVQAGKTGLWNLEVTGLDQVQSLPGGQFTITADEVKLAAQFREAGLQAAAGVPQMEVKQLTPTFTGNLNQDFQGATFVTYQKSAETTARSAVAYDAQNLYLGWEVKDPTPWLNSADAPQYMYARGDTVDFQLGTDPQANPNRSEAVAGDLRLSIGQVQGKPVAVIYRKVALAPQDKQPQTFSSGIVREYVMESVKVLDEVRIEIKKDTASYTVEAAVPLAALGLRPAPGLMLSGDLGVTHSNPAGDDTRLRTYWSNQETGLVDDEVYELMMKPSNWGQLKF